MAPKLGFYVHSEREIVSRHLSTTAGSANTTPQWISRAAPVLSTARSIIDKAEDFYANYPIPQEDDVDNTVPPLPAFDDTATTHFLPIGLPGVAIKHVPKRYMNSVGDIYYTSLYTC